MTAAPLTVHNAEIHTAAVEIKTLTVSGKQVTLAVFRQLIEEHLIDKNGGLKGTPWGVVNYHPDKCSDHPYHLHVIWQDGGDLRRATLRPPRDAALNARAAQVAFVAAVRDGLHRQIGNIPADPMGFSEIETSFAYRGGGLDRENETVTFLHGHVQYEVRVSAFVTRAYRNDPRSLVWVKEHATTFPTLADAVAALPGPAYLRTWQLIRDLPQLFIAV